MGDGGTRAAKCAQVLDIKVFKKVLVDDRVDASDCGWRSTRQRPTVDKDVQAAQRFRRRIHCRLYLCAIGYVGDHRNHFAVGFSGDLFSGLSECVGVPGYDDKVDALTAS